MAARVVAILLALAILVSPGISLGACSHAAVKAAASHPCCCGAKAPHCPMSPASNVPSAGDCGCAKRSPDPAPATPAAPADHPLAPVVHALPVVEIEAPPAPVPVSVIAGEAAPPPRDHRYLSLCSFRC